PQRSTLFPYTTLFRSLPAEADHQGQGAERDHEAAHESEDRVRDDIVDATDVVVHPREQVPRAAAGEEPDRLLHQAPEELPAEVRSEEHTSELQSRGHL